MDTKTLRTTRAAGVTFLNQYAVLKYLGAGACGRVYLVMDTRDQARGGDGWVGVGDGSPRGGW